MAELKIAMLGYRGVGKTSLLTGMYHQFDETFRELGLQLTPDAKTASTLQMRLAELKAIVNCVDAKGGLVGDSEPQSFSFTIGKLGSKPSLKLTFQDIPGGFLDARFEDEEKFINKIMDECVVILIAIHAPGLMEKQGKWHDFMNRPEQVCHFFERAYGKKLKQPRLIILTPVRCEKYIREGKQTELLQAVKDRYAKLLGFFSSESLRDKVACVVTPVQTVGTVILSALEEEDREPIFHFRKVSFDADYEPKDCNQPLLYLLSFVLKLHYGRWSIANPIGRWLGWDAYLKDAIGQTSQKCKSAPSQGFDILQGKKQLEAYKK